MASLLRSDPTWSYDDDNEGNRTRKSRLATGEVRNYRYDFDNALTLIPLRRPRFGLPFFESRLSARIGYETGIINGRHMNKMTATS